MRRRPWQQHKDRRGVTANHYSAVGTVSRWREWAGLPHIGGACGLPRTSKGLFILIAQAPNLDDMDPEERKVISKRSFSTSW